VSSFSVRDARGPKPLITLLNLNGNKIGAGGAQAFAEHMGSNEHPMPHLCLSRNHLGDDGAAHIATLLRNNRTISQVHLAGNGIGDRGVAAICDALGAEALVTEIDLADNNIGTNGALAIQRLLQQNATLMNVNLSGNKKLSGSAALAPLFQEGFTFPQLAILREC